MSDSYIYFGNEVTSATHTATSIHFSNVEMRVSLKHVGLWSICVLTCVTTNMQHTGQFVGCGGHAVCVHTGHAQLAHSYAGAWCVFSLGHTSQLEEPHDWMTRDTLKLSHNDVSCIYMSVMT